MPDTKVSALTDGTTANSTDAIPIARSGANYYITPGYIKTFTSTGAQTFSVGSVNGTGLDISQTWTGTGTYTGLKYNVGTDSGPANAASLLLDLQVGGTSQFNVSKSTSNLFTARGHVFISDANALVLTNSSGTRSLATRTDFTLIPTASSLRWGDLASFNADLILTRATTATLQLGAADVSSGAVAQTLQVQSNTGAGQSGQNFTIKGSAGPAGGGSIIFQTAATTSFATALTINSSQQLILNSSSMATTPAITVGGTYGWYNRGNNWAYGGAGNQIVEIPGGSAGGLQVVSPYALCFGVTPASNPPDVYLYRDDADKLALRRPNSGATSYPQTFNIYNTFTDTANYERGYARWSGNVFQIGTEKGTSGNARQLQFQVNGSNVLTFATNEVGTLINTLNVVYSSKTKISIWPALTVGLSLANNQSIGWDSTDSASTSPDTILIRGGAANVIGIGGATSSFPALKRISSGNCLQVIAADNTASAGFIVGNQALATTATDGFIYVPTCAGTPTGTPTTQTGTAPIVVDTTNNKLYFYSGGAWRDAGP